MACLVLSSALWRASSACWLTRASLSVWTVRSWRGPITTSSGCLTETRGGTWPWKLPERTASLEPVWNLGECVQVGRGRRTRSVWIVWTSIRRFCTRLGTPLTTLLLWLPPTTCIYSRTKSTRKCENASHPAKLSLWFLLWKGCPPWIDRRLHALFPS